MVAVLAGRCRDWSRLCPRPWRADEHDYASGCGRLLLPAGRGQALGSDAEAGRASSLGTAGRHRSLPLPSFRNSLHPPRLASVPLSTLNWFRRFSV